MNKANLRYLKIFCIATLSLYGLLMLLLSACIFLQILTHDVLYKVSELCISVYTPLFIICKKSAHIFASINVVWSVYLCIKDKTAKYFFNPLILSHLLFTSIFPFVYPYCI